MAAVDDGRAQQRWQVRYTWTTGSGGGLTFPPFSFDESYLSRPEAQRGAQLEWSARRVGLRISAAHLRLLPDGPWEPVEPASLCGAVDEATGQPIACHPAPLPEPAAAEDVDQADDGRRGGGRQHVTAGAPARPVQSLAAGGPGVPGLPH